jgi:putative tryptophan/tyrosine transport system substrate-binding protein
MRRREFISLLGATASGWPFAAQGQQPSTKPVIGFLSSRSPEESAYLAAAFRRGIAEAGYIDGQTATIEARWAEGRYERLPALAAELAAEHVSLIAATGDVVTALAAKSATSIIPIVFVIGGDPVRFGLVASFNHPGGNITGISLVSSGLGAKRLGLLHELIPNATVIGLIINPKNPNAAAEQSDVEEASHSTGQEIYVAPVSDESDFEAAFENIKQQRAGGILVATDPFLVSQRARLVAMAARYNIPTMYQFREFATGGGLMSYGTNITDAYFQVGAYAGRILKGESAADLPVIQETKLELVINRKTAAALGLAIPSALLVFADEVIE